MEAQSQFIEMFGCESNAFKGDKTYAFDDICYDDTKCAVKVPASEYQKDGKFPIFDQSQDTYIAGYTSNEDSPCEDVPVILFGDHSRVFKYINQPFYIGADGVKLIRAKKPNINTAFMYYSLLYKNIPNTGYNRHFKWVKLQKFVLPPMVLQEEFVSIARQADKSKFVGFKSQFIEMFGNQNTNDKGWTESLVKDEFKLSMGKTPARNNPECWDNGTHKWVSISDMSSYTRYTGDTSEYITDYAIADSGIKAVPKGTIIMSFKLSIGRTAITSEDLYTNEAIMAFAGFDEKKFNIDFLHFLIANKNWLLGAKQAVKGQTLNKESIGNAKIIIPPIEAQEEFASIYNQADKSKYYN